MTSITDRLRSPATLWYLSVLVMLAGMAILAFEEATTDASTIGLLVIVGGLLVNSLAEVLRRRADEERVATDGGRGTDHSASG